MHAKMLTPVTLILTSRVCVQVSKFAFRFRKLFVTPIPLIFGTHMPWDKTFPCMSKIQTPVTLTLTSESAFRFQNMRLGLENCSLLQYQLRYTFNIWHIHPLGQDLSIHVKILTPVTLTLTSESAFRFQNLRLGFENWS